MELNMTNKFKDEYLCASELDKQAVKHTFLRLLFGGCISNAKYQEFNNFFEGRREYGTMQTQDNRKD